MNSVPAISVSGKQTPEGLKSLNNNFFIELYKKFFHRIKHYITTNSGLVEDAEDVFHDALMIIFEKVRKDNLVLNCSLETYLFSICRHLWFHRMYHSSYFTRLPEKEVNTAAFDVFDLEEEMNREEMKRLVNLHYSRLDLRSRQTLQLYISGISHKETAKIMGYKSLDYAKTRKYICKEKLKGMVRNDPAFKQLELKMLSN